MPLAANDASLIPQPSWEDVFTAYVAGATAGQAHPLASREVLQKSADAHCKLLHLQRAPANFAAFHQLGDTTPAPVTTDRWPTPYG